MRNDYTHEVEDEFPNLDISNEADFTQDYQNTNYIVSPLGHEIGQFSWKVKMK